MDSVNERHLPLPWIETPLIESASLSKAAGCRIFLKLENLQPGGSFKSRAVGNFIRQAILARPAQSGVHFYCSSGGNAGLACVTAARTLGHPASVVVPETTEPAMVAKIRAAGATAVIQTGASWLEADQHLREEVLAGDASGVYVPPFDHADVWAGNATMTAEIKAQMGARGAPDAVVLSVGGGGLFAGVAHGLRACFPLPGPRLVAVETAGADSLSASLRAGEMVTLPRITSQATSLGARRVADEAFRCARRDNVASVVVTDAEAAMGCWRLADDERMLVELACGASVALAYDGRLKDAVPGLGPESKVVIVVCGGSGVSVEKIVNYRRRYGAAVAEGGLTTSNAEVPSTHTAPKKT